MKTHNLVSYTHLIRPRFILILSVTFEIKSYECKLDYLIEYFEALKEMEEDEDDDETEGDDPD